MRLWHEKLLPYLPKPQLGGLHREICAMRGLGWGKKHYIVNYVWEYEPQQLVGYHKKVMDEMINRSYNVDTKWYDWGYRGKKIGCDNSIRYYKCYTESSYLEHDDQYLSICLHNLKYSTNDKGKVKNIDLFKHFPNIKDLGHSLDDLEKEIRTEVK